MRRPFPAADRDFDETPAVVWFYLRNSAPLWFGRPEEVREFFVRRNSHFAEHLPPFLRGN